MSTHPRFLLVGTTALALVAGLAMGVGAVLGQEPTAPSTSPSGPALLLGAPSTSIPSTTDSTSLPGTTAAGVPTIIGSGGSAVAGAAIAFPYFGGTPGIAPDHTIVVTGTGQADMKADGSNRAAAEKIALDAALADAKAQADAIASATGLSISGVLSVSASVSPYPVVMPMGAAPDAAPNGRVPAPGQSAVSPAVLGVSVTVAYRVG